MTPSVPPASTPDYDEIWTQVYGDMQHVGPVHRHMKRLFREVLDGLDYDSVLDVGCGPGGNIDWLGQGRALDRVAGIDISPWAIEQARQRHRGEFQVMDIQQDHLDGQWDLVFCSLVLEHLPDDEAALRHLRAMTGRYLLASTIAGDFERYRAWDEQVGHVRNYRRGELEEKLLAAGFRIVRPIYWGYPFYSPIVRTLQNKTDAAAGEYNWITRLAARILYHVFFLNSRRRGDLLIVLAEV